MAWSKSWTLLWCSNVKCNSIIQVLAIVSVLEADEESICKTAQCHKLIWMTDYMQSQCFLEKHDGLVDVLTIALTLETSLQQYTQIMKHLPSTSMHGVVVSKGTIMEEYHFI
ncbi:uncharacterized protein BJ212DRAFT_1307013 [Suillus subaureus]|uniref:Uncharacterized protein n=1 Tax=Suillus subaureus TaxID=48587 RepID=A0A9P7APG5_9AGAM|nr:uncharacterized protein BJ212DRAFT_1307013 [Suillus subaureus]KAG1793792.1 hypothetical protein BJ212DRAFT_1307013 [Suillus subaureus]